MVIRRSSFEFIKKHLNLAMRVQGFKTCAYAVNGRLSISCRNYKHSSGIRNGAMSQNRVVDHVAALKAMENPTGAIAAVALKIHTHFLFHVPVAPPATLLMKWRCGRPRCLAKPVFHGSPPSDGFNPALFGHALYVPLPLLVPLWHPP